VRLISEICLNALTGRWIGDSITCYRDSGRGRKASQEEKTRSERYPKKINLKEIKPERHQAPRQTSKRDISTRLIPEGVFGEY
jgi:hypothetical protein